MKKALSILLILALICVPLAACGGGETPASDPKPADPVSPADPQPADPPPAVDGLDNVALRVWGGEEDQAMLRIIADAFIAANADKANITIDIGVESEGTAKDTILTDPLAAADVFAFADDQIMELYNAGALQEVLLNPGDIKAANVPGSVDAATVDGKLMAYPLTADNGYFLFYDSSQLSPADVGSWDSMMDTAAANGKQVAMNIANGWFYISFFRSAGLDAWIGADGSSTETNMNGSGGTDVVQGMLDIVAHPGFIALDGEQAMTGAINGEIVAFVSGPWDANGAADAWGDNYAATKLPTFNLAGSQVQMGGVLGCKLIGVNAFSEWAGWAMMLAEFISNYENQLLRFEMRSQGPSNIQAASSSEVQSNIALAAMAAQAEFSKFFAPGGSYWGPAEALGNIIADGNPDGTDLQELLDNAVAGMAG